MNPPKTVTDATFKTEVLENALPVLVDFWAPWCGPCRLVGPVVEELAAEYEAQMAVYKLNTDENPETARRYHIDSIPSLLVFRGGEEVKRIVGFRPKVALKEHLDALLGSATAALR